MDCGEQQAGDEDEVIDEESEFHRVGGEPRGAVEQEGQQQDVRNRQQRGLGEE